ncbi:MAG TPA: hypothetical protein VKA38_09270 [Draconibacterium sp.]|nr:hypothetical protein [Draconibacterium sp.]
MKSETLKEYFLTKIKERDFSDFSGTDLSFHVPVSTPLLNFVLNSKVTPLPGMEDMKSVELSELNDDKFRIKINHDLLNKTVNCAIHEIGYTMHGQPVLTFEFIGGFKFYERVILNALFFVQKGWGWLKSKTADDDTKLPAKRNPVFEVTGSHLSVNMSEWLRVQDLDILIPMVKWERFSTKSEMLIVDFRLKV